MAPRHTRYAWTVEEMAYHLWAGPAGRNSSATARLLADELGTRPPVPTDRTIRNWSRHHYWMSRLTRRYGPIEGRSHRELMAEWIAVELGRMDVLLRALDGDRAALAVASTFLPRRAPRARTHA